MSHPEFVDLADIDAEDLLALLNEAFLRKHLVDHARFDKDSVREWVKEKRRLNALPGCRVRAIRVDGRLAGWCGIQPDDQRFELAIVLSRRAWGLGIAVFKVLMGWAREFGHEEVVFHLLDSRPEYRSLARMAHKVHGSELSGRRFTTYRLAVERPVAT
ncbi:MAG: N-acetyltransferase [Verrucomicrobiota bacterium JB024]|nr:N-acetyltransferase [Verrucomicrobiota bacterium JB024]